MNNLAIEAVVLGTSIGLVITGFGYMIGHYTNNFDHKAADRVNKWVDDEEQRHVDLLTSLATTAATHESNALDYANAAVAFHKQAQTAAYKASTALRKATTPAPVIIPTLWEAFPQQPNPPLGANNPDELKS